LSFDPFTTRPSTHYNPFFMTNTTPAGVLRYGRPINLEQAKHVAAAAEACATANGWAMVIAIVDCAANMVVLHRQDHAQTGSIAVALAKAKSAAQFKRPTKVFEDALAAGGLGWRLLSTPGACALEGGLPLVRNGEVIGAIGVSGMQSTQDAEAAAAGVAALDAAG
jgi:uncharacterized protein GlcG (DUF336 family)